jgi:O-antigen/teichoic acid export membrane protein
LVGAIVFLNFSKSAAAALVSYVLALAVAEAALAVGFGSQRAEAGGQALQWQELRRLTLPIVVLMFAVAVFQNIDMLVVKRFFPREVSGSYGAATALARGIGVIFVPLNVLIGPVLTNLHASGKPVFGATWRVTGVFVALGGTALIVLSIWSEPIMAILYGESFLHSAFLLAPLAGVGVITYSGLLLSQALITLSHFRFLAAYTVLAALQVVALLLFHATLQEVVAGLYAVQGAAFCAVVIAVVRASRGAR